MVPPHDRVTFSFATIFTLTTKVNLCLPETTLCPPSILLSISDELEPLKRFLKI